jgi:hypothetical protein
VQLFSVFAAGLPAKSLAHHLSHDDSFGSLWLIKSLSHDDSVSSIVAHGAEVGSSSLYSIITGMQGRAKNRVGSSRAPHFDGANR